LFYRSTVNFIHSYIPVEDKPKSLEYFHDLNKGYKHPKDIIIFENTKHKQEIDKLKKKRVNKSYLKAYSKFINSDKNSEEKEENCKLFFQMNDFIKVDKRDSNNYMEITELNDILYQQVDLKLYGFCAKTNNFNLMKLIWEFVDKVYKMVLIYSNKMKNK